MAGKVTYKPLFALVNEQIDKKLNYDTHSRYENQTSRSRAYSIRGNTSDVSASALINAIQDMLSQTIPSWISDGLRVTATEPESAQVLVAKGKGAVGGMLYELLEDTIITIPFGEGASVYYIELYNNAIIVEKSFNPYKLTIAKVVVPEPLKTNRVINKKDGSWDAYIVNFHEYKLYGLDDKLEEDSIELLRDNIGEVLADNLIGNIRLSEDLKITNTQGTLTLDSNSMTLQNLDGVTIATFNRDGTAYYDDQGIKIAKFGVDEAYLGNILISKNSIQSRDYQSDNKGFKITDTGFAEFEDVRVRGRISSSVFEYDKVSAIGGKVIVANSSAIASNMSYTDTDTLIVDDSVFSINDILYIKDGSNEEYLLVTDNLGAGNYSVERDLANAYASNGNPRWPKGTAIVSTGSGVSGTTSGFIKMDAVSQYSPFIDIILRHSDNYNDLNTKVRLGNLAGITDSLYGNLSGFGLYSDNVYLKGSLYAPDIKTAIDGARIELNTCCMAAFSATSQKIFELLITGANSGDLCIGNYSGCQGVMWDQSAGTFSIRGSLNACDFTTGTLSADRIGAGTIYTCNGILIATRPENSGTDAARTEIDTVGIRSYNNLGVKKFELCDGHIYAEDIVLQDPNCTCCYSCLQAGALHFHDECGDVPYVKRICSGTACTGTTICLPGWKTAPEVIVGIKTLKSYVASQPAQDQEWNIYADGVECYIRSGNLYGYCFDVHAELRVAAGVGAECVKDVSFGTSVCTEACTCSTIVRNQFQLWKHGAAPSNYCYGTLCYAICYRKVGDVPWCANCYEYIHPHSSLAQLTSNSDQYQTLTFPCMAMWEILGCEVSVGWTDSGIASGTTICCLCTRALGAQSSAITSTLTYAQGGATLSCEQTCTNKANITVAGSTPTNTFCTYACVCYCSYAPHLCTHHCIYCTGGVTYCNYNLAGTVIYASSYTTVFNNIARATWLCTCGSCTGYTQVCIGGTYCTTCKDLSAYNACAFPNFCICTYTTNCYVTNCNCTQCIIGTACSAACLVAGNLFHCYCTASGDAATCCYQDTYSVCDTYGCYCVLDPAGCVSWLAIAYS